MKPRILVLLTAHYPSNKGDSAFVKHEIDALAAQFDRVLIFSSAAPADDRHQLPANVEYRGNLRISSVYRQAAKHPFRFLTTLPSTFRAVFREWVFSWHNKRQRPLRTDLRNGMRRANSLLAELPTGSEVTVYSFWGYHNGLAIPFLPRSIRTVVRMHGGDLYEDRAGELPLRAALLQRADTVMTVSSFGKEYLQDSYESNFELPPIVVARLGTSDHGLAPIPDHGKEVLVVSCSAVIPVKRVDSILPAVARLSNKAPTRWIHFGDGDGLPALREQVTQAEATHPNLSVELRGFVDNQSLMQFYAETPVDAFVNVSESEGLPVSIMEAMSFGIPVVATDVGGTSDLVGPHLQSGVLLPKDFSTDELTGALAAIIENRGEFTPRAAWRMLCDADTQSEIAAQIVSGDRKRRT